MNLAQIQAELQTELQAAGISSARLDVLILLEDILGTDRSWVLAHAEVKLSNYQVNRLRKQTQRRKNHEPLAYIRGFSDFFGRRFRVNKRVLEPRPESETMIELMLKINQLSKPTVADVGTGCGCLGITAALEIPGSRVELYDIDSGALAVAKHNVHLHELHLSVHKRDLLNRPARPYDIVLANLPYVPDRWKINPPAMREPRVAIFGGRDGLGLYRRLFTQLKRYEWKPGLIFTEALPPQHAGLADIAAKSGFKQIDSQDFIQVFGLD